MNEIELIPFNYCRGWFKDCGAVGSECAPLRAFNSFLAMRSR